VVDQLQTEKFLNVNHHPPRYEEASQYRLKSLGPPSWPGGPIACPRNFQAESPSGLAQEVNFSGERTPRLDQAGWLREAQTGWSINFQNKFFV
jgi:hypothetical protein